MSIKIVFFFFFFLGFRNKDRLYYNLHVADVLILNLAMTFDDDDDA
jgi:hypothetical protein